MLKIKKKLLNLKDRLTNIGNDEPLSKLSLVVIIILDLFILSVIFEGLYEHTTQLTSPNEYIPYQCQQIFIKNNWSKGNQLSKLQPLILSDYNNYAYRHNSQFEQSKIEVMHPLCKAFYTKVKAIASIKKMNNLFVTRQNLTKKRTQISSNFNKSKDVYNTSLLENIATKDKSQTSVMTVAATIKMHTMEIEKVTGQLAEIEAQINSAPEVKALWKMINPNNKHRGEMVADFKDFQYWYPLKELLWQLVFLLPIFVIFYLWSSRSVKKNNSIQTLLSSHLLVIASIPILSKVIEVVLDLIPHVFFKKFFKVLESLHLIAVWHYIVILGSVGIAFATIYIIQKKIFNKQRVYQKRLMKGACYCCGKHLPDKVDNCPFCGTKQMKGCDSCQEETYIGGPFCKNCGCKRL